MLSSAGLPVSIAPVVGPIPSGYLAETSSWRMVFCLNMSIGIAGALMSSTILRETARVGNLGFDYKKFILAGIGFSTALPALTRVADDGWTSTIILGISSCRRLPFSVYWRVV